MTRIIDVKLVGDDAGNRVGKKEKDEKKVSVKGVIKKC